MLINDHFFEFCFILDSGAKINILKVKNDLVKNEKNIRHSLFLTDSNFQTLSQEGLFGELITIINEEETPYIIEIQFYHKNSEIFVKNVYKHKLSHNILGICANGSFYNNLKNEEANAFVYVQFQNGNIYKYLLRQSNEENSFPFEQIMEFSSPFQSILATNIDRNLLFYLENLINYIKKKEKLQILSKYTFFIKIAIIHNL